MNFQKKKFSELNTLDLFKIYELRALVFVVEQNCPYQDVDELDLSAEHVLLYEGHTLAAYARILRAEKESYPSKIGRVVVHPQFRGRQTGKELM
ncbi:MAG: GNAT family N-acetyltransferase, partial [Sphingobacteriia bacterium]|nr:GNAT family N-acetyltransferase [Sphingobacteriia bacterium]